jgi:uncharacterized linocin/CFP29 family protein
MPNNFGRDQVWDDSTWQRIDSAVRAEVGRIRVAQKIFPGVSVPGSQSVPTDQINTDNGVLTIEEGATTPLIEIGGGFALTQGQVDTEGSLHTGERLALQAARLVALTEDRLFFRGAAADVPDGVVVRNSSAARPGLLGAAETVVEVEAIGDGAYRENTFRAVTDGISRLIAAGQPGPYAFVLESALYADTFAPSDTLTTTADRLTPLLTGGFYGSGALEQQRGILISLGGEPTTIYVGQDATTSYVHEDANGDSQFRVFERVQLVARDHSALVRLDFAPVVKAPKQRRAEPAEVAGMGREAN